MLKCANIDLKCNDDNSINEELINIAFEHDYVGCDGWAWNEYNSEIVTYISGFIVKFLRKKVLKKISNVKYVLNN